MPTSDYGFERWLDDMFGGHIKTYVSANSINTRNEPAPVKAPKVTNPFEIQSVLSNRKKNAFTVVWTDGTHTTVHCQSGDEWDDEKALAMCFTKKALGNKGNFNDKFNHALDIMKTIHTPESAKEAVFAGPCHYTNAPEKACACDGKRDHGIHSCTECKCKEESEVDKTLTKLVDEVVKMNDPVEIGKSLKAVSKKMDDARNSFGISKQTADELSKAANKASNSLKELIDALTGENVKVPEKKAYCIFKHNISSGEKTRIWTCYSMQEVRDIVKDYARKQKLGYYYRTWNADNGMYIDYGSHSEYIFIPDITNSEYIGK